MESPAWCYQNLQKHSWPHISPGPASSTGPACTRNGLALWRAAPTKQARMPTSITTSCIGIPMTPSTSLMSPWSLGSSVSSVASSVLLVLGAGSPSGVETQPTKSFRLMSRFFAVDGAPVESVGSFRCLGRQETRTDSDWGALCANLRRARYKWHKLSN